MSDVASGRPKLQAMRDINLMLIRRRRLARPVLAVLISIVAASLLPAVAVAADDIPPLKINNFIARSLDASGHDYTVAGGHPDVAETSFSFPNLGGGAVQAGVNVEMVKQTFLDLPAGFVGNPATAARCTFAQLAVGFNLPPNCPPSSAVGTVEIDTTDQLVAPDGTTRFVIYNMVPERGYPAQFGFNFAGKNILLYPRLRSRAGQYGITIASPGIATLGITRIKATLFGVPSQQVLVGGQAVGGARVPFLSNPVDCLVAAPVTNMYADVWARPARLLSSGSADFGFPDLTDPLWESARAVAPPVTGCDSPGLVSQFAPSLDARPTAGTGSSQVDAPSGFTVDLDFPQSNDPTDSASTFDPSVPSAPPLKDATVTLPEGVAISPSAADGLDGCSDVPGSGDQVHYETTDPVSCPDGSKVGSVTASSPLLAQRDPSTDEVIGAEPISGDVFIIKPHAGDLDPAGVQDGKFRLLIQVDSRKFGVNLKLPGIVTADRATGRLTARFEDNPQVPAKHLRLVFDPGPRAALVNPVACGAARTGGVFTPWSRGGARSDGVVVSGTPDVTAGSSYEVSWDGNGAGCPSTLPFGPTVTAGTVDSQARASSPFTFDLTRGDRQDVISGVSVGLPGGLLASVKDVPLCSDADANSGACPVASRVGSATVAAGPGDSPFYLRDQSVSLTGPYKGAPYGLAIAVHAVAGPFDLGTVVVRQALDVDPDDVHATVVSDPLPTIRDGVPFRVRRVHVVVDRPGFMRSPSSCDAKSIATSVFSAGGQTASLTTPIRFTGCDKLPFAPKLALKLTGAKEAKVGGHPGIEALVTQQAGEAGIKAVTVTLPLSLALDPNNAESDSLCEYLDGLKDQCPAKSVIGTVTAISPLLKTPLNGKVYFVKGVRTDPKTGRQIRTLPTLLIELRGEINVNLRATNSVPDNQHLTSTFPMIPDAPISSFSMKLNGGKKGILVITDGNDNICSVPQKPFLAAQAHNDKRLDTATTMSVECPLAIASRAFTTSSVKVKVSGLGPGRLTISGPGIKTTRRTITAATSATVIASLTATGKRLRRTKRDVRIKATFAPRGAKKAKTAFSAKPKKR
jgi:hypothetical protein